MHTEVEGQRSEETLCSQFSPPHALPRDRPQVMSTAGQVPLLAAPSHWPGECIVKDWFQRCSPGTAPGLLLMRLQNQFRFLIPSYSKFPQQPALEQTLALTQTSLLLAFVCSDYPRLSEYQDKITDNQGLENNQAVGIETVIVHPCKDRRDMGTENRHRVHKWGSHQITAVKGRGDETAERASGETGLHNVAAPLVAETT